MNFKAVSVSISASTLIFVLGCTKADPKLDDAPAIALSLDNASKTITSPSQSVVISGGCDKRLSTVELSFDGSNWMTPSAVATSSSILCSTTKRFTFSLDPSAPAVASYLALIPNQLASRKIYVRGKTSKSGGAVSTFVLSYEPIPQTPQGAYVLSGFSSGSQLLSSSSYKLKGRIGVQTLAQPGTNKSVSTNYVLKSGMQRGD